MREVIFLQDFATKKAGEKMLLDSMVVSDLIRDGIVTLANKIKEVKVKEKQKKSK